ncbi:hypothetical protein H632_c4447p0 [Helicosporidium sp. ATCC 50920]|nr:hypothetical protein H632_c4447p0 [Helicosporidium sp. ATCC 50920]|eukprot:KDD71760.1 hypothetical protein H632_c4447p0 [Helicosporidium sp. ATCC 50920]
MEWVRPRLTAMHLLQALHPELPMQQLLQLLHMTIAAEEDDEPEGLPGSSDPEDAVLPGQSSPDESEEASDSGVGDAPLDGLRRGPRPARVPGAVWPSPSAPSPREESRPSER